MKRRGMMRAASQVKRHIALRVAGIMAVLVTIFGVPATTHAQGQNCADYDTCLQGCGECNREELPSDAIYQRCEKALSKCDSVCDRRYRACSGQAKVNRRRSKAARVGTSRQFCAPGVCLPSQRCCVRFANDRPVGHLCVPSNQGCPNPP